MTTEVIDEPTTETQGEQSTLPAPEEKPVCTHCDALAVCHYLEADGGGAVALCNEHAGEARASGKDLFVIGTSVPFEYVPAPKVFTDPEDAEPEPPIDPTSPEALEDYDRETREMIDAQALEVADAKVKHEAAKEIASARKKSLDLAQDDLLALIQRRADERGKPKQPTLFKDPPAEQNNAQAGIDAKKESEPKPEEDDSWREQPLSILSLSQGLLDKLKDPESKSGASIKPILTLGDYHDFVQPVGNGWVPDIKDIKGVGAKAADQIADAFAAFWQTWNNRKAA